MEKDKLYILYDWRNKKVIKASYDEEKIRKVIGDKYMEGSIAYDWHVITIDLSSLDVKENEKKKLYSLRLKPTFYRGPSDEDYLNFNEEDGCSLFSNEFDPNYQVKFTQDEIDWIKEAYYTDLSEFEQIEVE